MELQYSDKKYRDMVEHANEAIIVAQDGRLKFFNSKVVEMSHYTPDELSTMPFVKLIHPEDQALVVERYRKRLLGQPVPDVYAFRMVDKYGKIRWVEIRSVLFSWEHAPATLNFLSDVTEKIFAEQALQQSEARFRSLVQHLSDIIWIIDETTLIKYVTPSCSQILGYDPEAILGMLGRDLIHPEDWPVVLEALDEVLRKENLFRPTSFRLRHEDGHWVHVEAVANNLLEHPSVQGIVVTVRDVSGRKAAEATLAETQALLMAAVEQTPAGILIADAPDVRIRLANAAALGIRGEPVDTLTNIPAELHSELWQTFHPDGRPYAPEELPLSQAVLYGRTVENVDAIIRRSDGEERWVLANAAPVRNAAGEVVAGIVVFPDITEFKQAEAALQRRNRDLIVLNQVIGTATSSFDPAQILDVLCRELVQAFHISYVVATLLQPGQSTIPIVAEYVALKDLSVLDMQLPVDIPILDEVLQNPQPLYVSDAQCDARMGMLRREMRRRDIMTLLLVPLVVRGRIYSIVGLGATQSRVYTDEELALIQNAAAAVAQALEAAELHQELQRHADDLEAIVAQRTQELQIALKQARAADEAKSQFVSSVSHELRTPLTSIQLYLDLLKRAPEAQKQRYHDSLTRETARLRALIERVLTISRLDLGKVKTQPQPIQLNQLLQILVQDRERLFASHQLDLDITLADDLPLVLGDENLLEQVATNLLTNAMHYTHVGGQVHVYTEVKRREGRRWVTFGVSDNGPGISAEEREHLFERFYRGAAGLASDAPGTGLGLPICKDILDLYGGHITVDSVLGQGSTFTVWLPVP